MVMMEPAWSWESVLGEGLWPAGWSALAQLLVSGLRRNQPESSKAEYRSEVAK